MAKNARKNKSKKEVIAEINQARALTEQEKNTKHLREVIHDKLFPFLLEMNDSISYTKIFMQTAAVTLDSSYEARSRTIKVGDFIDELKNGAFSEKDNGKFIKVLELFKDETLSNFSSMMAQTPRFIDMYYTQEKGKESIKTVDIAKILG